MKAVTRLLFLASILFLAVAVADETTNMKPYPAAEQAFERMVFRVPAVEDESAHKVEIITEVYIVRDCKVSRRPANVRPCVRIDGAVGRVLANSLFRSWAFLSESTGIQASPWRWGMPV